MRKIINFLIELQKKLTKPVPLGRWGLKNCHTNSTQINAIYQNRDHCGDIICKTPVKADIYKK